MKTDDPEINLIGHIIVEFKKLDAAGAKRVADYAERLAKDPKCVKQPEPASEAKP